MASVMMHDSEPSEQDGGGGKAAEDGIINLQVDDLSARAGMLTSICFHMAET